jgi:hypothetical protein
MYQGELSVGLERRLREDLSASIRVVRKHLYWTIEDSGVMLPDGYVWWIGNPGRGIQQPVSKGGIWDDKWPAMPKAKRDYIGVNLELEKRFSNNWVGGVSYTWSHLWGNYSGLAWTMTGQESPNLGACFDRWFQPYTWQMNPINGTLPTDRPHYAKIWGSYAFDFGLTAGFLANAYSGTPITTMLYAPVSWYPDGFFTDGRTPFMMVASLYAEYNINLSGNTRLNFSVNVDNLFDNNEAIRVHNRINNARLAFADEDKATGQIDWRTLPYDPNPMYMMNEVFYYPRSVRLGVKFIF